MRRHQALFAVCLTAIINTPYTVLLPRLRKRIFGFMRAATAN